MPPSSLWIPYSVYLLYRFAHFLLEVPTVRMIELSICYRHFQSVRPNATLVVSGFDEMDCKTAVIQQQVALIVGWKLSFDALPGS